MTGPLREELADYLALRRALGYRLARPEKLLGQFLDHLEQARRSATITVDGGAGLGAAARRRRLELVGLPAVGGARVRHLPARAWTRRTRCRPRSCCRSGRSAPARTLYSDADIAALIAATGSLRTPLRRATFATLIGLLAVTGIRVGEAIALDRGDVDLAAGRLVVRHGKFDKARELALHPTTVDALRRYQRLRDRTRPDHRHLGVVGVHGRDPAALLQRPPRVPPAGPPGRARAALGVVPAPHSRPPTFLRGRRDARRLRRRPGRADPPDAAVHLARSRPPGQHLLVPVGVAGADGRRRAATRSAPGPVGRSAMTALAPTLQAFFTDRLIRQRHASGHTIAAYRDTWRLLLGYAATTHRIAHRPQLDLADLDAPLIAGFLDHLEHDRGNSVRTRNARLAAIHSLFRFAALAHPEHADDHLPRPGDPTQTLRPGTDQLPHRTRGRRPARQLRPDHLDRPT